MGTSPSRIAAVAGTVIATLMSGCAGGGGGSNLPVARSPMTQRASLQYPYLLSNSGPTCTWSIVPSPSTLGFQSLYGVEAASRSDAWAVGEGTGNKTLAMRWN